MLIIMVFLHVLPDFAESFVVATLEMAHTSLRERGCRRFEVIRDENDSTRFILYKLFNSRTDGDLHVQMEHYVNWEMTVVPMLSEPMHSSTYTQLF